MKLRRIIKLSMGTTAGLGMGLLAALSWRFEQGRKRANREWNGLEYPPMSNPGSVKRLRVLPLIDWYAVRSGLATEPGVSYLVQADDTNILFDVGYNQNNEHPSPLLRNMRNLGVEVQDIDAVFISHTHSDHLGGAANQMEHAFGLSAQPVDLGGIPAYVPEPLLGPGTQPIVVHDPLRLFPGVVSLGPIARQLFFLGWTPEQSLAVNVEGKGVVLIIGCGHSTIQRIVQRAEMLFDTPIYGIIGGLHYPVTASREAMWGLPAQQFLGTGKWPWHPVNRRDVLQAINFLRARRPGLVSLSPHDSCDWTLNTFRRAFGETYHDLLVGDELIIA